MSLAAAYPSSVDAIIRLKSLKDAVIVAHDDQLDIVASGIADFVGDSLAIARFAATCGAGTVVVCGVYFMAEMVKLLSPEKHVLIPNLNARCTLAESIDAGYVREMRRRYAGFPVVAYVNTPAEVKAEADICCTSANAVAIARSLAAPALILLPYPALARRVARATGLEVVTIDAGCCLHGERGPTGSVDSCSRCGYMKSITIDGLTLVLEDGCNQIEIDPVVAPRARRALERTLAF